MTFEVPALHAAVVNCRCSRSASSVSPASSSSRVSTVLSASRTFSRASSRVRPLTQGARHLKNARDDPPVLVGPGGELCPQICPRLHRFGLNSSELLGLSRHKSPANGLLEPILSPETGVRIPVAVLSFGRLTPL